MYEGKALTIAGFDPSGGAGIQADLKTFLAFNVYGASVVTSIAVENTTEVRGSYDIPANTVEEQIDVVMDDIDIRAAKTGMLSSEEIIKSVAKKIRERGIEKLVVDPVMVAKTGGRLLKRGAEKAMVEEIVPLAYVITPNVPEAEVISGIKLVDESSVKEAAMKIHEMGAKNVIIKGGHLTGDKSTDLLYDGNDFTAIEGIRVKTKNTHGTGCTFSAAIAASLAKGKAIKESVRAAKSYVQRSIELAPHGIGKGYGPLYHNVTSLYYESESAPEDYDSWFSKNQNIFESELLALKEATGKIPERSLAIGSGTALFESKLGIKEGIELSPCMAEKGSERGVSTHTGSAYSLPYEDNTFDMVLFCTSLDYMEDPARAVKEAYRVLKEGGAIVVSILPKEGSYAMLYDLANISGYDPERSPADPFPVEFLRGARWLSVESATDMLKNAGFREFRCTQTLTCHPRYSNESEEMPVEGYKKGDYVVIKGLK
ncbi:MAG: bifunctional hydroxymethylpyrimidine kinase/phosphomethylpyrimidine kinase [Candidatus Thermoplasmatota archaeon]|nr:bifunctional hydroxymethylpyrimidine kinase/phosphomethylpyrimidine kinase [Candidatus Thermoplasmatota archaeon]